MCLMVAPKRTPALLLAAFREWVGHSGVQEGFREKLENQVGSLPGCQSTLVRPPRWFACSPAAGPQVLDPGALHVPAASQDGHSLSTAHSSRLPPLRNLRTSKRLLCGTAPSRVIHMPCCMWITRLAAVPHSSLLEVRRLQSGGSLLECAVGRR